MVEPAVTDLVGEGEVLLGPVKEQDDCTLLVLLTERLVLLLDEACDGVHVREAVSEGYAEREWLVLTPLVPVDD